MKFSVPSKNLFIADSSNLGKFYFNYIEDYSHCAFNIPSIVENFLLEKFSYDSDKLINYLKENGSLPSMVNFIKENPHSLIEWDDDSKVLFLPLPTDSIELINFDGGYFIKPCIEYDDNFPVRCENIGFLSIDGANIIFCDSQSVSFNNINFLRDNIPSPYTPSIDAFGNKIHEYTFEGPIKLFDEKFIFNWDDDGLIKANAIYNKNNELLFLSLAHCDYSNGNYDLSSNTTLNNFVEKFYSKKELF